MNELPCGCCTGTEKLTPQSTANRPGLSALRYRIGSHAEFLETMLARLGTSPPEGGNDPLRDLRTREAGDPAIALLDAWATVADVLTFYQERIANEGYLRTATERRSVLELARLVGYRLRPGVASSVFLAYTLNDGFQGEVVIEKGAQAQSVPGPGEAPQTFQTSEDLKARAVWNDLRPRTSRPQTICNLVENNGVYLQGIATNLKPNDPLLVDPGKEDTPPVFVRIRAVTQDAIAKHTFVEFQGNAGELFPQASQDCQPDEEDDVAGIAMASSGDDDESRQGKLIRALTHPPSAPPATSQRLQRDLGGQFSTRGESGYGVAGAFAPALRETLTTATANAAFTGQTPIRVHALRLKASLYGHNHPGTPHYRKSDTGMITVESYTFPNIPFVRSEGSGDTQTYLILVDPSDDRFLPNSWLVLDYPLASATAQILFEVVSSTSTTPSIGGLASKASLVRGGLKSPSVQAWLQTIANPAIGTGLTAATSGNATATLESLIRGTTVYAGSEILELAESPMRTAICGGVKYPIELDGHYDGLEAGRWAIVSGEREIEDTSGVRFSELTMLASVTQDVAKRSGSGPLGVEATSGTATGPQGIPPPAALPGDKIHTFITLATPLEYCFKRDTVIIHANVVKATHGAPVGETLGGGDGSKAFQSFPLKQPPVTHIAAATPAGAASTLKVYVNDIEWHEADALAGLAATDRRFVTKTGDDGKTTLVFGDGRAGARLPTGVENVRARYRSGIGKAGNVKPGQISQPLTRPLGVREVVNPLRASGGADAETRDQARKNAPLAVTALNRLVSVQDYADFARTFAGIGKAHAAELSDGRRRVVHLTIAGAGDIPIDRDSDLYRGLGEALRKYGDPSLPVQIAIRELLLLVVSAGVRLYAEYRWEAVEAKLRAALLDAFGFERRELGQDALLSEVFAAMQAVEGVAYVDVDTFGGIPEKTGGRFSTPEEISTRVQSLTLQQRVMVHLADARTLPIAAAQIAFLSPEVPATLILNQIA